ncbi:MAG: thiol reductant ABC exporter subunit CydD [Alphaproteobacteria bacterium]|nr:thiol reductant ABC exporter subunit CydD [Alphaproteobacteria bacterium]
MQRRRCRRVLGAALAGRGLPYAALGGFLAAALVQAGCAILVERFAFDAGAAARRRLRGDAMARLLAAGPAMLRGAHSGALAAVVIDRIEAVDGLFARWLPAAVVAFVVPVAVAAVALALDPIAGLILIGAGLLVPAAMALSGLGAAAAARGQFAAMARLQTRFLDRVSGIATIVLAGRAEAEAQALARAADELRRRTMRVLRVAFLSSAGLDCAAAIALIAIAVRYGGQYAAGTLASLPVALFMVLATPQFFAPLRAFAAAYQERMHAIAAAEALVDLPALPPETPPLEVRTVSAHGITIDFRDVSLSWDATRGKALDGVTFRIPAGQVVILAGPSGSGKTSIIEILLGFVRPDAGRVTFNGADIATLVPQALARLTAWVGQRPVLFAASIAENIRFAKPEASDDEVETAAEAARVVDFAILLPQGLDTVIGEGGYGLSGGQAQRIAIARAFLKDAPILLLDEPTAHLDPVTEADVLDSLKRLCLGRTTLLASHATAAHAFSARRVDLRGGRVVGTRGTA